MAYQHNSSFVGELIFFVKSHCTPGRLSLARWQILEGSDGEYQDRPLLAGAPKGGILNPAKRDGQPPGTQEGQLYYKGPRGKGPPNSVLRKVNQNRLPALSE